MFFPQSNDTIKRNKCAFWRQCAYVDNKFKRIPQNYLEKFCFFFFHYSHFLFRTLFICCVHPKLLEFVAWINTKSQSSLGKCAFVVRDTAFFHLSDTSVIWVVLLSHFVLVLFALYLWLCVFFWCDSIKQFVGMKFMSFSFMICDTLAKFGRKNDNFYVPSLNLIRIECWILLYTHTCTSTSTIVLNIHWIYLFIHNIWTIFCWLFLFKLADYFAFCIKPNLQLNDSNEKVIRPSDFIILLYHDW